MYKRARDDVSSSSETEAELDAKDASSDTSALPLKREALERVVPAESVVTCALPPRCDRKPRQFWSTDAYERHYKQRHAHACLECGALFPSAHLSDLHAEEMHDVFFATRIDRGELAYRCLAETCADRFASTTQRRKHLLNVHGYPAEFRFNVTRKGLDVKAQSLLYPADMVTNKSPNAATASGQSSRKGSAAESSDRQGERAVYAARRAYQAATTSQAEAIDQLMQQLATDHDAPTDANGTEDLPSTPVGPQVKPDREIKTEDVAMDDLTQAFDTARLVPRSIHFGRGKRG